MVQLSHWHLCNLHFILVLTRYDRQMLYSFLGIDYFNWTNITTRLFVGDTEQRLCAQWRVVEETGLSWMSADKRLWRQRRHCAETQSHFCFDSVKMTTTWSLTRFGTANMQFRSTNSQWYLVVGLGYRLRLPLELVGIVSGLALNK